MMNLSGNCCAEKFVVSNFCLSTEAMKINQHKHFKDDYFYKQITATMYIYSIQ